MKTKEIIKQIVSAIDKERYGLPVSIADIRKNVTCSKELFDKIILGLAKSGRYFLNRHFHPITMTEKEKESAIYDGKDNYYIYIIKK